MPLAISLSNCCVVPWRCSIVPCLIIMATSLINTASLLYCSFEYPVSYRSSLTQFFSLSWVATSAANADALCHRLEDCSASWSVISVLGVIGCKFISLVQFTCRGLWRAGSTI